MNSFYFMTVKANHTKLIHVKQMSDVTQGLTILIERQARHQKDTQKNLTTQTRYMTESIRIKVLTLLWK